MAGLFDQSREKAKVLTGQATEWVEGRRDDGGLVEVATQLYERDRDAFGTVLGSALALRLFLFVVPADIAVFGLINVFNLDRWATPLTESPTTGEVATRVFAENWAQSLWIFLSAMVLTLWAGRSLARVLAGFFLAAAVAIPLGFVIGMSPVMRGALDPFIQVMKPISPLAWMPLALYTIKDSSLSAIFVIFICSLWPMLINTAHGVASVKREWLNVALTLEVSPLRKAFQVILPAAAPTILTGMRISMGIAWLVIVAAEMLVGGTGIGYFVWNEWNNLSLNNVIFAILSIGVVGMVLDLMFGWVSRLVAYRE